MDLGERIAFTLKADILMFIWLAGCVGAVSRGRFFASGYKGLCLWTAQPSDRRAPLCCRIRWSRRCWLSAGTRPLQRSCEEPN